MTETAAIQIAKIGTETIEVPIVGTMPLIVHNFSEKSKRQMLDAQQGRKNPKQVRDPQAEFEAAFYRTKDGYGFPVTAFKAATGGRGPLLRQGREHDDAPSVHLHARRDLGERPTGPRADHG